MGTVTAYNLADVQAALGGGNPISMSEYYRGGAYVPTQRQYVAQDGPIYQYPTTPWSLWISGSNNAFGRIDWQGTNVVSYPTINYLTTSYTSGIYTYYRWSFVTSFSDKTGQYNTYQLYRQYYAYTPINTGVPSSGQISISQLYGAANP